IDGFSRVNYLQLNMAEMVPNYRFISSSWFPGVQFKLLEARWLWMPERNLEEVKESLQRAISENGNWWNEDRDLIISAYPGLDYRDFQAKETRIEILEVEEIPVKPVISTMLARG